MNLSHHKSVLSPSSLAASNREGNLVIAPKVFAWTNCLRTDNVYNFIPEKIKFEKNKRRLHHTQKDDLADNLEGKEYLYTDSFLSC